MWNEDTISLCAIRYFRGRQGGGFPCTFGCGFVDHAGRCVFTKPCGHCARLSQFQIEAWAWVQRVVDSPFLVLPVVAAADRGDLEVKLLRQAVGRDPKIRRFAIVLSFCRLGVKIQEHTRCRQEMSRSNPKSTRTKGRSVLGTRIISTDHQADGKKTRKGPENGVGLDNEIVTKQTEGQVLDCEVPNCAATTQSEGGGLHVQSCQWRMTNCAVANQLDGDELHVQSCRCYSTVSCSVLWSVVALLCLDLAS